MRRISALTMSLVMVLLFYGSALAQSGVGASLDVETILPKQVQDAAGNVVGVRFSAKFLCGTIPPGVTPQFPFQPGPLLVPGTYLTVINIHNPDTDPVDFRKKALITNPQGQQLGTVSGFQGEALPANHGLEVDCHNIAVLLGFTGALAKSFIKGFVVIESHKDLDVVAVYTLKNVESRIVHRPGITFPPHQRPLTFPPHRPPLTFPPHDPRLTHPPGDLVE